MRIARIANGRAGELVLVDAAGTGFRRSGVTDPLETLLPDGLARLQNDAVLEPLHTATLLAPLLPRTFVGVGLNYRAHAAEQGRPLPAEPALFLKNSRSVAAPVGDVPLHPASSCLDYEAELGIVIGRPLFAGTEADAAAAIAGWVVVNDFTLRDLARAETLAIAKGGPGMGPIGPWVTTVDEVPIDAARALAIGCDVNGEPRQASSTADMHFGPVELVHRIARYLPLGPGDMIATGSPGGSGVGFHPPRWLRAGDLVQTRIEGLGELRHRIVSPS